MKTMALSREITLTIDNYNITLDKEIKIYEYDAINLCFTIQEYGIVMRDGKAHNRVMPVVALKAYMLIETPQGVDSVEATNIVRNKVIFSLGNKYSQFVGVGKMQIILRDLDGCRITLPEFNYEVKQSINTGWEMPDVLIGEKDFVITDELGRPVETTKISEMDEVNEITPQTYTMVINEDGNKKIKLDTIMESISETIEFDVEEIDRRIDGMIDVYDDEEIEVEFPSLHNDVERIKDEINEISESLDSNTKQLSGRIDTIIANNNTTDGNSELVDIRVGNDGTKYNSAGECVRNIDKKVSTFAELKKVNSSSNLYNEATTQKGSTNMSGVFSADENSPYKVSDYIKLSKGSSYAFSYGHSTLGRYHLTFSRFVIFDLTKTFLAQTTSDASIENIVDITVNANNEKYTLIVPKQDVYIRFQIGSTIPEIMVKKGTDNIYEPYGEVTYTFGIKDDAIDENNLTLAVREKLNREISTPTIESVDKFYYAIHRKGICIGDSLTEGYHYSDDIDENRSYPAYLSRFTNWDITNAGQSGITVSGWYNAHISKYNYADYDFAIIYLGTNGGMTDTLIQDTTISEGQTYKNYANTHTGSYCKIIETILEQNPKCKIYLIRWDGTTTAKVTTQIAEKYNLDTINLLEHTYFNLQDSVYHTDATHYNSLGYMCFAKNVLNFIEKFIEVRQLEYTEI